MSAIPTCLVWDCGIMKACSIGKNLRFRAIPRFWRGPESARYCALSTHRRPPFRQPGMPIVVYSRTLNACALASFQCGQRFFFCEFLELDLFGKNLQPVRAFFLGKVYPVNISARIWEQNPPSGHRREEFRQKVQSRNVFSTIKTAQDFGGESCVDRRRSIPIGFHARLSRSSATAWAMASGSSL